MQYAAYLNQNKEKGKMMKVIRNPPLFLVITIEDDLEQLPLGEKVRIHTRRVIMVSGL